MATPHMRATTPTSDPHKGSMAPTTGKEIIAVPNNLHVATVPSDGFVIVHTAETALFQTMRIPALVKMYIRLLLTTTSLPLPKTIDTVQTLADGLTTLQLCSDILSKPSHPRSVLFFLSGLDPASIAHFSKALDIIFETRDWTEFEREALHNGDFDISPVVWAIMLGPRGLVGEFVRGKMGAAAVLRAEEEWVEMQEGEEGFEKNKKALRWFAGDPLPIHGPSNPSVIQPNLDPVVFNLKSANDIMDKRLTSIPESDPEYVFKTNSLAKALIPSYRAIQRTDIDVLERGVAVIRETFRMWDQRPDGWWFSKDCPMDIIREENEKGSDETEVLFLLFKRMLDDCGLGRPQ
ncbi:hypothetical protein PTNB85_04939 [Pyrenophora teres f. teres]|nr:hypothetical protein HRS9139_04523 [Pyrenophora teres f. teres]KAE8837604.1 hypothetical protein PTNB85_04939 [Pyrenophora teres f. teres]KAE8839976.1 hypothetical protein HRS9122_06581 [Pyrenophora teres f. teres]